VIASPEEEKSTWLMKNIDTEDWINLNEEVVFPAILILRMIISILRI